MLKLRHTKDKWGFVAIVTAASVFVSLAVTLLLTPSPNMTTGLTIAATVPLMVAPIASTWAANRILEIRQLNQKLEHMAHHDPMTGLLNRAAFFTSFQDLPQGTTGTLMMLDLDKFKSINDTHGHHIGDKVICHAAEILQSKTGNDGFAARFGGEEFVVFIPDEDMEDADLRAELIRAAIENLTIDANGQIVPCSMSIGVEYYDGERDIDTVLQAADAALYTAKNSGRNRVVRATARNQNTTPAGLQRSALKAAS